MKKISQFLRAPRPAGTMVIIGVFAGITIGGGVGVVASSSWKPVTVCVNKANFMRYSKTSKCAAGETKVVIGQTGATGPQGDAGTAGAKGDTGIAGATGAKGDTGAAGAKGDTGAAGAKGDAGSAGAKGDIGLTGDTGAAGAKGDTGTAGTNGANTNSQIKNICGVNGTTACAIGLKGPGGGIVFMTPSTLGNTSGLFYEAAPSTWSSPTVDPGGAWCSNTNLLLSSFFNVLGTGAMDGPTKAAVMLGVCTSGAANLADAYTTTVNGVVYGDWFLPSKGELNQMYINRTAIGGFLADFYWSSSEFNSSYAWLQAFNDGNQTNTEKTNSAHVRPVRTF
jgi:hypothetical protein